MAIINVWAANAQLLCILTALILVPVIFDVQAEDGFQAVKKVMSNDYKLILMDVKMPKMNGIDALKAIKIIKQDVPILIVTGYAVDAEKEEGLKAGAAEIIIKPFCIRHLIEKINFYINKPTNESVHSEE